MPPNQIRILAVEDDPSWQFNYQDALEQDGYICEIASSLEQAMAHAQAAEFQAAIVDLRLADEESDNEDGILVLESLAEHYPHMRFVVCTGYGTREKIEKLKTRLPVVGWIDKNKYQVSELITLLEAATSHADRVAVHRIGANK